MQAVSATRVGYFAAPGHVCNARVCTQQKTVNEIIVFASALEQDWPRNICNFTLHKTDIFAHYQLLLNTLMVPQESLISSWAERSIQYYTSPLS